MKRKVGKRRDIVSHLPIPILHRFLSFLSDKDSAKTSVLSKQWNFTRKSFPRLTFTEPCGRVISNDKLRLANYLDHVDRSLQYFIQHKLCVESLFLNLYLEVSDFTPAVDTWLPLALHSGASDITFAPSFNEYYPLPETTFSVNSSLLCDSSEFFRLQKLTLHGVILSENMVRNINRNCPNLADLVLCFVSGLKTLNISKPIKLATLHILNCEEINNVSVDALSINHSSFEVEWPQQGVIDLTSCCNLRELQLCHIAITDDLFHLNISRFPLLVFLDIKACNLLRRIKISQQRLERLRLCCCNEIEDVEIDAPILSQFEFISINENFPKLVSTNIIHGSMDFYCSMYFTNGQVNSFWFLKIREYLSSAPFDSILFRPLSGSSQVDYDPKEVTFNIEELREAIIPPLVEVDCLSLDCLQIKHSSCWPTVLQGLFWSCHPKTVTMTMHAFRNFDDKESWMKVFCKTVRKTKCLKTAKVESIEGDEFDIKRIGRKELCHAVETLSSVPENSTTIFTLEWDHSRFRD